MDETGFEIGTERCSRVIIKKEALKTRYVAHPGRQEWVSAVECVCADGTKIPPLLIFKGEKINSNVLSDKVPSDWQFAWSSSGWTSNIHGLEWLQRCLNPQLERKQTDAYGFLFVTVTIAI